LKEIVALPTTALQIVRNTALSLWSAVKQAGIDSWSLLIPLALLWTSVCLMLGVLKRFKHPSRDHNFTHKALFVVTALLLSNRFSLLFGGLLIITGWMLEIIPPGLTVISSLVAIW
jgi:CHASE2 domain-containing sensor protein